jgi:hypothetical protein
MRVNSEPNVDVHSVPGRTSFEVLPLQPYYPPDETLITQKISTPPSPRFEPWTVQPIGSHYGITISLHCNAASAYLPLIYTAEILYSNL